MIITNKGMYKHQCDKCYKYSDWHIQTTIINGVHSDWNKPPKGWTTFMEGNFRRDACEECSK